MDSESLKIILALKEENVLLKRAITDAYLMLRRRMEYPVVEYGMQDVEFLLLEIKNILEGFKEEKQQPSEIPQTIKVLLSS
jgi:hypothetical protein